MIYYLQSGPDGPVKIGQTIAHIGARVSSLQMASPYKLVFLGSHSGDRKVEQSLHKQFAGYRFRGEWFYPVRSLLDHINAASDGKSLDQLMRNDLRAALAIKNRKHWRPEDKAAFSETFSGWGNPISYRIGLWMSGMSAPTKEIEEKISAFLQDRNIPISEVAQ